MKFIRLCLSFVVALSLGACKDEVREISPDKLCGYWRLQNDVKFSGLAFTHMWFFYDNCNYNYVDPVVYDTIYEYKKVFVTGDSLCLTDYNDKEMIVKIKELSDSAFVLTDFPGASDDLVFRNPDYERHEDGSVGFKPAPWLEYQVPKDSLDINMKSYDVASKWANVRGEYVPLSNQQVAKARDIAREYLKNKAYLQDGWKKKEEPKDFDEYLRQYFGYKKDGKLIVAIEMSISHHRTNSPFPYSDLKTWIRESTGGGCNYLHFEIDIEEGKVLSFNSNVVSCLLGY